MVSSVLRRLKLDPKFAKKKLFFGCSFASITFPERVT